MTKLEQFITDKVNNEIAYITEHEDFAGMYDCAILESFDYHNSSFDYWQNNIEHIAGWDQCNEHELKLIYNAIQDQDTRLEYDFQFINHGCYLSNLPAFTIDSLPVGEHEFQITDWYDKKINAKQLQNIIDQYSSDAYLSVMMNNIYGYINYEMSAIACTISLESIAQILKQELISMKLSKHDFAIQYFDTVYSNGIYEHNSTGEILNKNILNEFYDDYRTSKMSFQDYKNSTQFELD